MYWLNVCFSPIMPQVEQASDVVYLSVCLPVSVCLLGTTVSLFEWEFS